MRLPTPVLLGLIGTAFAVLIGLGVWQVQRNEWKQDLVAESHARTDAAPLDIVDASTSAPDEIEYHRVLIEGEPRFEDAMFLANRARSSVRGEEIVVPVQPPQGPAVLVNFGWIPDGARDEVMGELDASTTAPIAGLAVDASGRNGNQIPSGSWSNLDTEAMGEALGYPVAGWFVLAGEERDTEPSPSEEPPVAGWQRFHNTTPHVEYALTWFGLAAALVAVAVFRLVVAPRQEAARAASRSSEARAREADDRPPTSS